MNDRLTLFAWYVAGLSGYCPGAPPVGMMERSLAALAFGHMVRLGQWEPGAAIYGEPAGCGPTIGDVCTEVARLCGTAADGDVTEAHLDGQREGARDVLDRLARWTDANRHHIGESRYLDADLMAGWLASERARLGGDS